MDEDDTVFDSFVVDNSVVEYVSSLDELDMVDEFQSDVESSNKTRYLYSGDLNTRLVWYSLVF